MTKRYDRPLTLEELAQVKDEDIDYSDIPELDETFWKNARLVEPEGTQQITLRVKKSVLEAQDDRQALYAWELPDDAVKALETARPPEFTKRFDHEV